MKINNKRGVSEVVASVLLILLVIASIVILWAVYQRFIEGTTEGIADSGDCIQTDLNIVSVTLNTPGADVVRVKRNLGSATITHTRVLVNGQNPTTDATNLALGQEVPIDSSVNIVSGDKVEVSAEVNGVICAISDTYMVP